MLIMVSMEEVDTLNAAILQLRKEKEDREENFHQVTGERNYLRRDLDQAVEQLKRSDIMIRVEEDKKEKAYVDLQTDSSSLKTHNIDLDKAQRQSDEWKVIWMNSTKAQREMRE